MNTTEPTSHKPLRLWPGVAAAVLLVLFGYVIPIFVPRFAGLGDALGVRAARSSSSCGGCSSAARAGTSAWARSF